MCKSMVYPKKTQLAGIQDDSQGFSFGDTCSRAYWLPCGTNHENIPVISVIPVICSS